jgi:hypothetical protein
MVEYPTSLQAEYLIKHMQALCKRIGPRPSTSAQERQAADYVEKTLRELGVTAIQRQPFKSPNSSGWVSVPCFIAGALAAAIAHWGGQWGKLISSALLLGSTHTFWQCVLVKPVFFHKWIARGTSQNIIAHIPAAGRAKRTIYLVGHLDSQKQRFQFPPSQPEIMKAQTSLPLILGVLGGCALLVDVLLKRKGTPPWLWPLGAAYLWGAAGALYDETQPHVEGANDNATAVSILLGIAQALATQPLQHSDVALLFTGCEEVGCVGMEHYLQQLAPSPNDTYWIDIEMVGTGHLCYVTKHGITYLSQYTPHPEMVELASRVAREHPQLAVEGKDMLILEEVANLRHRGYKAVCIAGYNDKGFLPNWHRLSDNLDNIEPGTLERAARYTWQLMQEIERYSENKPPRR